MPNPRRIAVATEDGVVSGHFGHAPQFEVYELEPGTAKISSFQSLTPPPHQPGVLPVWLRERGADAILVGGIGARAVSLLEQLGIEVVSGVPALPPNEALRAYLDGQLVGKGAVCGHGSGSCSH